MEFKIKDLRRTSNSISCSIFFKEIGLLLKSFRVESSNGRWFIVYATTPEWCFDTIEEKLIIQEVVKRTEKFCPPPEI